MSQVAAILLAAGQSRRMGAFKPLLPFGNKTVIETCVDYLRQGGASWIVVVLGHRAAEIQPLLSDVIFAFNPDPNSEMEDSIGYGMKALPCDADAVLIALTDQPAIAPEVVNAVISEWKATQARLIIPEHDGRGGHPVLIDLSFREQLLQLDTAGGLMKFVRDHSQEVRRVEVSSSYIARDIDTWEDYVQLHREVFDSEPSTG